MNDNTMKTKLLSLLTLGLALSSAEAITIDNLAHLAATGGTLTVDDKVFSNFGYQESNLSNFNPANILVTATQVGDTEYLTFTGNISISGGPGTTGDLILAYTVTAIGRNSITAIDQFYAGGGSPSGVGNITVDELVIDALVGDVVAHSHLDIVDISDPPAEITGDDLIISPGLRKLDVLKDIGLGVNLSAPGGITSVSVIRQSFHQGIPDAGTSLAMLGIALASLGLFGRWNRV